MAVNNWAYQGLNVRPAQAAGALAQRKSPSRISARKGRSRTINVVLGPTRIFAEHTAPANTSLPVGIAGDFIADADNPQDPTRCAVLQFRQKLPLPTQFFPATEMCCRSPRLD